MSKSFTKLRPSVITVDPRFQRDLDESRAKAMARKIEPDLLGVPVVSRREDGSLMALDAQHRLAACRIAGHDTPLLCEVHDGLSLHQEAELFLRLNGGRRAVGVFDKFKAQLVARDPVALNITAILKTAGLRVAKAQGKNCVCAIQALIAVYHRGNLPAVLGVLVAWSDGEAAYLEGLLIKALSYFMGKYPDINLIDFQKRLQPFAADRIISKLKRVQGLHDDVTPAIAAYSVFRDIYNHKRAKKSQLPAPDVFADVEPIAAE